MNNRISESIPADVLTKALQKLNEVKAALAPFLQSLTVEERHDLPKMSNKTYSFVAKTAEYCQSNPEFQPGFMVAGELNRDFSTVAALRPVFQACAQLHSDLEDTLMLAGSEAYTESLLYYNNAKLAAGKGEASARPIYDDLSARFPGRSKKNGATHEASNGGPTP